MKKAELNNQIIIKMNQLIKSRGYDDKLVFWPISSPCERRPRYFITKDGRFAFTAFMWQLNALDECSLDKELANRLELAEAYFDLI